MGSNLDRALLLAELLRVAGHSSRLARRQLTTEQARDVLKRTPTAELQASARPQVSATSARADADTHVKRFGIDPATFRLHADDARQKFEGMRQELSRRIEVQVPSLLAKVGPSRVAEGGEESNVDALLDYWWVQMFTNGEWVDFDPLSNGLAPALLTSDQTYAASSDGAWLPRGGQFHHEVHIKVIVEQRTKDDKSEHIALAYRFRPADAANEAVFLRVQPRDWTAGPIREADAKSSFNELALKQKVWVPTLMVGNRLVSQFAFTESGDLEALRPVGGVRPPAARALSSVTDAFGGSEPDTGGQLTAAWIEYEITRPGRTPRSFRRNLFDVVEPGVRLMERPWEQTEMSEDKRLERAVGLIQEVQILTQVSRLSTDYSLLASAREWRQNQSAVIAISKELTRDPTGILPESLQHIRPMSNRLFDLALVRFAWSPVERNVFLGEPSVLTYRTKYGFNESRQLVRWHGFDIVTGRVEALSADSDVNFRYRLTQGVADTNAEGILVGASGVLNAGATFNASSNSSWTVVTRSQSAGLKNGDWPLGIRRQLQSDLDAGYVVVVPQQSTQESKAPRVAWWRVDPLSGETLGIGELGWGQATVEEVIATGWISFLAFFHACMIYMVARNKGSSAIMKCLCYSVGVGFGSAGIVAGHVPAAAGAASYGPELLAFLISAGVLLGCVDPE